MKKHFRESPGFTEWVAANPPEWDATLASLQDLLNRKPEVGKVMKGCGGLRKIRIADPKRGKGRRGGARVIYLHVPEANWIFLMDIYDKNEREDLSKDERAVLAELARNYRAEAIALTRRNDDGGGA